MSYLSHFKYKAPEINLPHPRCTNNIIYNFFNITGEERNPKKVAICKNCKSHIRMIQGSNVNSSYTFGLTRHLQKHPLEWQQFLDQLGSTMMPDTKSIFEHYQTRTRPSRVSNKEDSSKRSRECSENLASNWKNCAGVFYILRDREILKNDLHRLLKDQNGQIIRYLYPYTNQNVHIFDLIGTRHENAPGGASYKQLTGLVDNDGDLIIDLERLLCENICFFDPEIYGNCPSNHEGDIKVFGEEIYQQRFDNFKEEIEKYPEFQEKKVYKDI